MVTKIEWVTNLDGSKGETWNPISGCSKISTGCKNCYAERMAKRLAGRHGYPEAPDQFKVTLHPDRLDQPDHWRKPRKIFVCSMGDLFHEDVQEWIIKDILARVQMCPQHIFQVLTKRPERMSELFNRIYSTPFHQQYGPIKNLWLGVTAENQETADERIPWLLNTSASVRFVSVEPMLGAVDLSLFQPFVRNHESDFMKARGILGGTIDWVICGGETGHGARPMKTAWAFDLYQQCRDAGVPFFFKKPGDAFQGDPAELPNAREFPQAEQLHAASAQCRAPGGAGHT